LYEISTGALLAMIEADFLGQQRTGAASGVARNILPGRTPEPQPSLDRRARQKPNSKQSRYTQAGSSGSWPRPGATCKFLRRNDRASRHRCSSAASPAKRSKARTSSTPPLHPRSPSSTAATSAEGAHINAIGATMPTSANSTTPRSSRAGLIFVDSIETVQTGSRRPDYSISAEPKRWEAVRELDQLIAGKFPAHEEKQITLFKSNGIASWTRRRRKIYALARQKNLGRDCRFLLVKIISGKIETGGNRSGRET